VLFAIGVSSWVPKGHVGAVFGSTEVFNFFYWGFIFLIVFSTSIWGIGQSIRTEQLQGTLEQLFVAPVSRVTIIIGRFARTILTDLAIIIYTVVLLGLLSHQTVVVQNPFAMILIFVFLEVAVLGFGFVFAALTFRLKSFNVMANLAQFAVIGLCGVFFPLYILGPVRYVSLAIPFTYFVDLIRFAAVGSKIPGGSTILDPALEFVLAILLALAMFVVGLGIFSVTEKKAREAGMIGSH
jgi:ABC-2 type transport system permease protein